MADYSINIATVIGSNQASREYAYKLGANLPQGRIVVLNSSNQWVAVSPGAGVGVNVADKHGILETGGNTNQPAVVITQDPNLQFGGTAVNGVPLYASPNAGNIGNYADLGSGNVPLFLGLPVTTSSINFRPSTGGRAI